MGKRTAKQSTKKDPVVWAYLRVSTDEQTHEGQENTVLRYANECGWTVRRYFTLKVSSTRTEKQRRIEELKEAAQRGDFDVLVCSELSRLGRGSSVGEIPRLVDFFTRQGVALHFVKERIDTSQDDMETDIKLYMFSLFAKIERRLISERTKAGLAARKAQGVKLGRPAGVSKLDPWEHEIRYLVQELRVPQVVLAEKYGCHEQTMARWLKRKKLHWSVGL